MKLRLAAITAALIATAPAYAQDSDAEWALFSRMITFVQTLTKAAAADAERGDGKNVNTLLETILNGKHKETNALAAEMFAELPMAEREKLFALGKDIADLAKKSQQAPAKRAAEPVVRNERSDAYYYAPQSPAPAVREPAQVASVNDSGRNAVQARKELNEMGLSYFDTSAYLAAVRRGDRIAVERYLSGRGVQPLAKDERGRDAAQVADDIGDAALAAMIRRAAGA